MGSALVSLGSAADFKPSQSSPLPAEPAAIALIDIRMPGRDGLWLAEQIRHRWSQTAIIVATGADDLGSIEKSRQIGAVDYVLKPFDRELLRQAMERAGKAIE